MSEQDPRRERQWGRIVVLGCAGLIVVGLAVGATIFVLVMGSMKRSEVYGRAMAAVGKDPRAVAALGEPIEAGFFVTGSISVSGPAGEASLAIPVRGEVGEGTLHLEAVRQAGVWTFGLLRLAVEGGETIDLLAATSGQQSSSGVGAEAPARPGPGSGVAGAVAAAAATGDVDGALQAFTGPPPTDLAVDARLTIWVEREYSGWENPLHSELTLNGVTVNIFTSDAVQPVAEFLRPGWNTLSLTTTPQEPASNANSLIFRIGPAERDERGDLVMSPVIWKFRNGTDWSLEGGQFSHELGPTVDRVTLTYHLFYAGLAHEGRELAEGNYLLQAEPEYSGWNTPVTATVTVNGTPLSTFLLEPRQVVVDALLQAGRNEVRLLSLPVDGSVAGNDVEVSLGGPARWNEEQQRFLLDPIAELNAITGWQEDPETRRLVHPEDPGSRTMLRTAPFILREAPPTP